MELSKIEQLKKKRESCGDKSKKEALEKRIRILENQKTVTK